MKESITKFDLEAAFKALDDIETPAAERGIRANKPALNEIFSRKSKFDALFEEYYDISNTNELSDAQEAREAEIAKAKLARIEKIVDLDADSPDDLLASYVGKYIIQCPQCMTLFYKNPEDVENSEEDDSVVNVNEVCQHCGNESGYTLIGKVGAADEETTEDSEVTSEEDSSDLSAEETDSETSSEDAESEDTVTDDAEDSEFDLDAIDFEEDDSEEEEKEEEEVQEESFANKNEGNYLLEQLNEEADEEADEEAELDISDSEFAELLSSPEFTKPISTKAAKAMLDNLDEAVVPCEELEEAVAAEENAEVLDKETLTEGGLGLLGKTLMKKAGQAVSNTVHKASNAIDKFADNSMKRFEKADWVLKHTLNSNVKETTFDKKGNVVINENDLRFNTYVIIGYKNTFKSGRVITNPPSIQNKDIVIGMAEPQSKKTYKEAEKIAMGWSLEKNGGLARIFLAKDINDPEATFLCQFFKGKLDTEQDHLEKLFIAAKNDLKGRTLSANGKDVPKKPKLEKRLVSELKTGDTIVIDKENAEIIEIIESKIQAGSRTLKLKTSDGDTDIVTYDSKSKITVIVNTETKESLEGTTSLSLIMEALDELNENKLEALISQSLIESYKNVAGFRLTGCKYLNEELTISGKVFFESGNIRDLTYRFTNAAIKNNKIAFKGLNEKLGQEKNFYLVGKANDKVFVAESFRQFKKV